MEDKFIQFDEYKLEKRSKISTMDTIISNNEDFKESEIDVLFRGYIVLIYAFWEGIYKKIGDLFYEFFINRQIKELPYGIRNLVIIELSTDRNDRNCKIGEIPDYRKIVNINKKINELLNKKMLDCSDYERSQRHFKEQTSNPNYDKLEKFLGKYNISLKKVINELLEGETIPENFIERLEFIVEARNNIAHGNENLGRHSNYKDYITERFLENRSSTAIEVSEFLRYTAFYIDTLYRSIIDTFKDKYMHHE
ncbi:hypothetical protein CDLVIII_5909 [Clostridium sp. DL-VIII]|uniref:MAE_28990/MAE_18760 family HEPN-like nuclease n=1 Tax=Clostridium sp. DL-VIII TaxID=641107 RepID=UPI00023B03C7|nr:MAE_28990/MAE_18760 family HEPN-like nuclease [Clostridium sp. DL-VIII]EHJ02372.1 hypothetical protein CDLVIII_5909 [Clostridium sp. DL-VIII]